MIPFCIRIEGIPNISIISCNLTDYRHAVYIRIITVSKVIKNRRVSIIKHRFYSRSGTDNDYGSVFITAT